MTPWLMEWAARLAATPVLFVAVLVALVSWAAAAGALWPRMPGAGWRLAWGICALGYLLAIVAFIVPPPERRSASVPVLVTQGATPEALAAIPNTGDAFVTGAAWRESAVADWIRRRVRSAAAGRTVRIAAVDDVLLYPPAPARLRVLGDGLDAASWSAASWQGTVEFTPPAGRAGIAAARWPRVLESGFPLVIEAQATAGVRASARFVLRDSNGAALASAPADGGTLAGPILPVGRHVLQLTLEADANEIERLQVPVVVRDPAPARVLVLQAAPSFEWRALGRWLGRAGALTATRTRISEARFRERFTGMPERPLSPLDTGLLSAFDLVIADGAALSTLDETERSLLLSAGHGAGVLVLLHDSADVAALPPQLREILDGDAERESVYQLPGSSDRLDTGLGRLALAFADSAGEALVRDIAGVPVAARVAPGSHVALSLVRDSYRLAAVGAADEHARLWSSLVRTLARRAPARGARVAPRESRAGERVRICVPSAAAPAAIRLRDGAGDAFDVELVATPWRPAERCGWAWPAAPGWLTVWRPGEAGAAPLGAHWVDAAGALATPRRLARIEATAARADSVGRVGDAVTEAVTLPRARLLAALLAFALLAALIERLAAARHPGRRGVR